MVFLPALLAHRQDTCQARMIESETSSVGKKQARKTGFSLSGKGLRVRKTVEVKGKNNTRASVWASLGPVSRVVTWLRANDSRFLSTTTLTLRELG